MFLYTYLIFFYRIIWKINKKCLWSQPDPGIGNNSFQPKTMLTYYPTCLSCHLMLLCTICHYRFFERHICHYLSLHILFYRSRKHSFALCCLWWKFKMLSGILYFILTSWWHFSKISSFCECKFLLDDILLKISYFLCMLMSLPQIFRFYLQEALVVWH